MPAALPAQPAQWIEPFARDSTRLVLSRPAQKGAFLDVVGRRAALLGYENESFEVWTYPLKLVHDWRLKFSIAGYPLAYDGRDLMTRITVRPEATTITYTHAAFTVRQVVFAPIDAPGVVMLLDVESVRPVTVHGVFRPDLRLMWPAGMPQDNIAFDAARDRYQLTVPGHPYAGVIAAPGARDVSLMPYQEEPRNVPAEFVIETTPATTRNRWLPIVFAGSMDSLAAAHATADRLLQNAASLYQQNVAHYRAVLRESVQLDTPDDRLDRAMDWALIGMDKGFATNPQLGTGLVAGFRTAGASDRPGFAWFFGRDALWTAFALTAAGDTEGTRTALNFLQTYQRADGKIPHEVSQSAALVDWFADFPYPWASADATPLFIIAHADLYQTTGDRAFLQKHWEALRKAYRFSKRTDTDGDHLIENTNVGHAWIEGGLLYPSHEELYLQGLWAEAARSMATLATVMDAPALAREARAVHAQVVAAMEATYWLPRRGHYALGTRRPAPGNERYTASSVLPAVPLWWGLLDSARAASQIDHLGSGALATDWGHRIVAQTSDVYDPLSYHNGSVWPLFTGWAAMGAYRYTRPHVGYQALMSTALLTTQDALGYITELLSGDFNTAFGRTSHHQIWSEAMIVTPALRGLLGLRVRDGGRTLHVAPQLPANWDHLQARNVPAGNERYTLTLLRTDSTYRLTLAPQSPAAALPDVVFAPALPGDATVRGARVNGAAVDVRTHAAGDRMRAVVRASSAADTLTLTLQRTRGTDALLPVHAPAQGAMNRGLRVLRAAATTGTLRLVLEGRAGRTYRVPIRSPHRLTAPPGTSIVERRGDITVLSVPFPPADTRYVRQTLRVRW